MLAKIEADKLRVLDLSDYKINFSDEIILKRKLLC